MVNPQVPETPIVGTEIGKDTTYHCPPFGVRVAYSNSIGVCWRVLTLVDIALVP